MKKDSAIVSRGIAVRHVLALFHLSGIRERQFMKRLCPTQIDHSMERGYFAGGDPTDCSTVVVGAK